MEQIATQLVDELVSKMARCRIANCGINSHLRFFSIYFQIVIRKKKGRNRMKRMMVKFEINFPLLLQM